MSIDTDFTTLLIRQLVNLGEVRLSASENILHHPAKGMSCYSGVIFSAKAGRAGLRELDDTMDKLCSFVSRFPGASLEWGTLYGPGPDSEMSVDFGIYYTPPLKPEEASPPQKASEEDPRKKQADQAKKLYQVLNPEVSRVCDKIRDALIPYGVIDRWSGCAHTAVELQSIGYDDFHVPEIGVRKISEPGKEAAFLMFISDGTIWGIGSRLIFTTVSQWLAEGFRAHDANFHLSIQLGDRGDRVKVFLEKRVSKEEQRLMHGDGRD